MIIQIDSREKAKAIKKIIAEFERQNVKYYVSKLYVGDYMSLDNPHVLIDRKQNLSEICGNVGGSTAEHERFRNELLRAKDAGLSVIILIEHGDGVKCLEDVQLWDNPRLKTHPNATTGVKLYKILKTMRDKYDLRFEFCNKDQTGQRIIELLNG